MNAGVIVGILLVVVLGAGALFITQGQKAGDDAMMSSDEQMMEDDEKMTEDNHTDDDSMMKDDEDSMMEGDEEAMMTPNDGATGQVDGAGSYEAYAPEKLAKAEEGDVVLFFRASWCPTCRTLDGDIRDSLNDIPAGVTILDVDYDNSTALKQKYGVTYQHTLVQVDASGNQIAKWTGSTTLEDLLAEIQ